MSRTLQKENFVVVQICTNTSCRVLILTPYTMLTTYIRCNKPIILIPNMTGTLKTSSRCCTFNPQKKGVCYLPAKFWIEKTFCSPTMRFYIRVWTIKTNFNPLYSKLHYITHPFTPQAIIVARQQYHSVPILNWNVVLSTLLASSSGHCNFARTFLWALLMATDNCFYL